MDNSFECEEEFSNNGVKIEKLCNGTPTTDVPI